MPITKNGHTILLGEDDMEVRSYLETALRCQGYSVVMAQDGDEVLACLSAGETPVSAVVLDVIMPRRDGMEALKEIRKLNRDLPIIMISGAPSALNVVEAMKSGANDFIAKPISHEDLRRALGTLLPTVPAASNLAAPSPAPANKQILFGSSPEMREVQSRLAQIGWSEAPVLIQGETGTGKEVLARELHACSSRAKRSLLKLNCAALPSELVESELFGYERGAFTGAFEKKSGMFALADGSTILLDEIGDMDFKLQAKLLQVLQDHEFQRLGGKETIKVNVRVIAATHRDLEKAIVDRAFREDLYYRLNLITITVPPLRERKEDIVPLSEFLLKKHVGAATPAIQIPSSLKDVFLRYHWPGNVRELENTIRKFLIFQDAKSIEQELRQKIQRRPVEVAMHTAAPVGEPAPIAALNGNVATAPPPAASVLEQVASAKRDAERSAIISALRSTNWNRKQASLLLQIDYKALLYKMNRLAIRKEKAPPQPIRACAEVPVSAARPPTESGEVHVAMARN